jgi:pimeloyl-ACP methyl ester carboxylesterase
LSIPDKSYVEWWISQVAVSSGEGLAGYAEFLSSLDSRPFLELIKVPTLILAPANSAATKLEEQQMVQSKIQGSRLAVIHGKGHEIYVEKVEDCHREVMEFLRSLNTGS